MAATVISAELVRITFPLNITEGAANAGFLARYTGIAMTPRRVVRSASVMPFLPPAQYGAQLRPALEEGATGEEIRGTEHAVAVLVPLGELVG